MRPLMLGIASCSVLFIAASAQGSLLANGSFEVAGVGGSADADKWSEGGGGAPGTAAARTLGDAHAGNYHLRIASFGNAFVGGGAGVTQNSVADAGGLELVAGTAYTLSFYSKTDFGPGGVGFYALRYLDTNGAILYNSQLQPIPQSSTYQLVEFDGAPAPIGAVAAFVEIVTNAGAFEGSYAIAQIDSVSVAAVPEPAALGLVGIAAAGLVRRRRSVA
jgi:MYXO-CTERM domain-containing protein